MNLFNRKTLKRHIKTDPIPSDHLVALEAWAELISSGRIERLKETALHGQFASKIVEGVLGYHGPAGGADYNVSTEQNILRGSVDLTQYAVLTFEAGNLFDKAYRPIDQIDGPGRYLSVFLSATF